MVIDGHAHSSGEFFRADLVVGIMDGLGVDKVILCAGPINTARKWPVPDITRVSKNRGLGFAGNRLLRLAAKRVSKEFHVYHSNAYVAGFATRFPGRIHQAYWADPAAPGFLDELKRRLSEWKFISVKLHQCFQRFEADSDAMRQLAEYAGAEGLPVFIHLFAMRDARALVKLATAHPRTTFIAAHLMGLEVFAETGRAKATNVYFDISPPNLTPPGKIKRALMAFGPERLLMGSDTPYGKDNLRTAVARVQNLDIPQEDKALILGENARRIYGFP